MADKASIVKDLQGGILPRRHAGTEDARQVGAAFQKGDIGSGFANPVRDVVRSGNWRGPLKVATYGLTGITALCVFVYATPEYDQFGEENCFTGLKRAVRLQRDRLLGVETPEALKQPAKPIVTPGTLQRMMGVIFSGVTGKKKETSLQADAQPDVEPQAGLKINE
mmetsp:Transcript_16464/g.25884  ORF Transcript_16464/g.25884 Transcript_16464/m.25884 type:complete len:166 (-) Transcript_16464:32-529(-)